MNACTFPCSGYTGRKPNGPVRKNTTNTAFATPNDKRGFVMPNFFGMVCFATSADGLWGMVGAIRKDVRTAVFVFLTSMLHLMRLRTQTVASLIHTGTKTMTAINSAHTAAPMSPQANTAQEAIAAHIGVHNCLSMAAWHIAKGNTPAAARKVRQALAALRQLDKLEG